LNNPHPNCLFTFIALVHVPEHCHGYGEHVAWATKMHYNLWTCKH